MTFLNKNNRKQRTAHPGSYVLRSESASVLLRRQCMTRAVWHDWNSLEFCQRMIRASSDSLLEICIDCAQPAKPELQEALRESERKKKKQQNE